MRLPASRNWGRRPVQSRPLSPPSQAPSLLLHHRAAVACELWHRGTGCPVSLPLNPSFESRQAAAERGPHHGSPCVSPCSPHWHCRHPCTCPRHGPGRVCGTLWQDSGAGGRSYRQVRGARAMGLAPSPASQPLGRRRAARRRPRPAALSAPVPRRVEAVQQALADLTGIPQADQILMCDGARLDAAKPLSAYNLPWVRLRLRPAALAPMPPRRHAHAHAATRRLLGAHQVQPPSSLNTPHTHPAATGWGRRQAARRLPLQPGAPAGRRGAAAARGPARLPRGS